MREKEERRETMEKNGEDEKEIEKKRVKLVFKAPKKEVRILIREKEEGEEEVTKLPPSGYEEKNEELVGNDFDEYEDEDEDGYDDLDDCFNELNHQALMAKKAVEQADEDARNKVEDHLEFNEKAAIFFKRSHSWDIAGKVYIKVANCHLKLDHKHEAAAAYVDAAYAYKKISTKGSTEKVACGNKNAVKTPHLVNGGDCFGGSGEAISCLETAVNYFTEIGRLDMAARYCKEIGDLYATKEDLLQAIAYLERAADLFSSEEFTIAANQCKQKVAQLTAELEQYAKAVKIYEETARRSLNNNLLKDSVKECLLNACLCQLVEGGAIAITNSLEKYQDLDPTFSGTREYKFLAVSFRRNPALELAAAIYEVDATRFSEVAQQFNKVTPLDGWKILLLLSATFALGETENALH
ncbi:hypothetical protein IFM89_039203 [Coptis chinensis]|uniref:Alpha-soluble NSF attachment protein n=1 Tax=Coptis chinensis TaxID=261450 RepID=A0A835IK37_9MAGN|nr:hypothetical protein IFM89_039203 [Coptis chinensis]